MGTRVCAIRIIIASSRSRISSSSFNRIKSVKCFPARLTMTKLTEDCQLAMTAVTTARYWVTVCGQAVAYQKTKGGDIGERVVCDAAFTQGSGHIVSAMGVHVQEIYLTPHNWNGFHVLKKKSRKF